MGRKRVANPCAVNLHHSCEHLNSTRLLSPQFTMSSIQIGACAEPRIAPNSNVELSGTIDIDSNPTGKKRELSNFPTLNFWPGENRIEDVPCIGAVNLDGMLASCTKASNDAQKIRAIGVSSPISDVTHEEKPPR